MKIVIIILAYNEEKSIKDVIQRIPKEIYGYKPEIILIDDGSIDKTVEIARKQGIQVISHQTNKGLGVTLRTGLKEAIKINPKYIVQIDGDGQYRPEEIPVLLKNIEKYNYDLVLGTRFKNLNYRMPIIKKIGNRAVSFFIRKITKTRISDTQTGFRVMNIESAKLFLKKLKGNYTYTQEMVIHAAFNNLKIGEVPLSFDKRPFGNSRLIINIFSYLFNVIKIVFNAMREYILK